MKVVARARRLSRRAERRIRSIALALGDHVECPYCGWTGTSFLPAGRPRRPNRLCPQCGALERYRALYLFMTRVLGLTSTSVKLLEVAPQASFQALCRGLDNVDYVSLDLRSPLADVRCDLTRACFSEGAFDIIVCLHVLEHIIEDRAALAEMRRILKNGGRAVIVVPMAGETTIEHPGARPEDYERLYGQSDHVRIYGQADFRQRLRDSGFDVKEYRIPELFGGEEHRRFAPLGHDETIFVCTK